MSSLAIRFRSTGGPEVLELAQVEVPLPAAGQITLRHHAVGVNFIDTYHRSGLYPVPLPSGLGVEACGVVEAVGDDAPFAQGELVAYATAPIGAYAERRTVDAKHVVRVPAGVDATLVAGVLLKGMTAEVLARRCHVARSGEVALVHAAAEPPWARHLGSSPDRVGHREIRQERRLVRAVHVGDDEEA